MLIEKILVFHHVCLVHKIEKWGMENKDKFCLFVRKKKERMKKVSLFEFAIMFLLHSI
jgi:hypothetical protein